MAGLNLRGDTSGSVEIVSPAVAGDNTITLPNDNGSANQFFKNSTTAGIVTHSSMVELTNGNIGVGTTNPSAKVDTSGTVLGFRYLGTENAFLGRRFNEGTDGSVLFLDHSRSNSIGVGASLNSGDEVGSIQFRSFRANNTNLNVNAQIRALQTGEAGSGGNTPSDLRFDTGGSERLRITNAGVTSVTGSLSVNDNFYPTTGPLSNRNLVMNGAMNIAQRNTGEVDVSNGSNEGYSTVDRWFLNFNDSVGGGVTFSQSSDAPDDFANSVKIHTNSTDTSFSSNQYVALNQRIEAQNLQLLNYGTSSARSMTLSWYMKTTTYTGPISVNLFTDDGTVEYYSVSVTPTTSWARYTLTIPGSTSATINDDNGRGMYLQFVLAGNTSSSIAASSDSTAWSTTRSDFRDDVGNILSSTSNVFYLTGVQLEVGERATPFEHRSYGDELQGCLRYTYVLGSQNVTDNFERFDMGICNTSTTTRVFIKHPVMMRTAPTVSTPDATQFQVSDTSNGYDASSLSRMNSVNGPIQTSIEVTHQSGTTANNPYIFERNNSTSGRITFSAEL